MKANSVGKHEINYARVERDHYPTPDWVIRALGEHVALEGRSIWECAVGDGRMVSALQAEGARVFASDIAPHSCLDAVFDFLAPGLPPGLSHFNGIATNPPWGSRNRLAERFIAAGLDHISKCGGFLALLLPTDFDSARTRLHLVHDRDSAPASRLVRDRSGSSATTVRARRPRRMLPGSSGRAQCCAILDRRSCVTPPPTLTGGRYELR
jgi:hypothetical protein